MIPLTFSKIRDPDKEDTGSMHLIDFGLAKTFISGRYPSYLINPSSNDTDPGVHQVRVILKDNNPNQLRKEYVFTLTVLPLQDWTS